MNQKLKPNNNDNNNKMNNKSPLRYPGGKTRACNILDNILNAHFKINNFDNLVSPFFGGGSFEFYIQNNYGLYIIANDKFTPLYNFWMVCKLKPKELCKVLETNLNKIDKEIFNNFRQNILNESNIFNQSVMYFIINRCSFSGATLSGGFSLESSNKRFTQSSISRINKMDLSRFDINNFDFEDFINCYANGNNFIFLDPPYYLEKKSKLYGNNGDMHEQFDHEKLYNCIYKRKNWMMTYNNCDFIKNLYKDFKIIETNWSYGMNNSKQSSEIVIISQP
jgi:DNA adenine methylase